MVANAFRLNVVSRFVVDINMSESRKAESQMPFG